MAATPATMVSRMRRKLCRRGLRIAFTSSCVEFSNFNDSNDNVFPTMSKDSREMTARTGGD